MKILTLRSYFRFDTEKNMMKKIYVCNVEIQIEETLSLLKAKAVVKENVKISNLFTKYLNRQKQQMNVVTYWFEKIMDVSTFDLYYQFEVFCRSRFKFLIGNFIVVLIRNFFCNWEPEFLKEPGPRRYFSRNWWNWCKNKSALGIEYLYRRNLFNWIKIR